MTRLLSILLALLLIGRAHADVASDTALIHGKLDKGGDVVLPSGVYTILPYVAKANLRSVTSEGAESDPPNCVLRQRDNAGKWARILTFNKAGTYRVSRIRFDMGSERQGPFANYELEQQGAIYAYGPTATSRVNITIDRCEVYNSVGDGFSFLSNVDYSISNCYARNVFRGAICLHGNSLLGEVRDCTLVGSDSWWNYRTGLRHEPANGQVSEMLVEGLTTGALNISAYSGSKIALHRVVADGFKFLEVRPGVEFEVTDSTWIGVGELRGNADFTRCRFIGDTAANLPLHIKFQHTGQTVALTDCTGTGVGVGAFKLWHDDPARSNWLRLTRVFTGGNLNAPIVYASATQRSNRVYEECFHKGVPFYP